MVLEGLDDLGDRGVLLADGDVDADDVGTLHVEDGVDDDDGLAGLAVADDELALAAADGDHRVDGLDARLQGLADGLPVDDAGGQALDEHGDVGEDGALAVQGLAERVDDAADQGRARRDLHDPARPLDDVPLADPVALAEEDDPDVLFLEVQGQTEEAPGKLHELVGHDPVEAVDPGDAVADRGDRADLADVDLLREAFDLLLDDLGDLIGFDAHNNLYSRPSRSWSAVSSPSTEAS